MMLFTGFFRSDESAKKLSYLAFVFPFFSGIILFFRFDSSVDGYAFEIFYPRMGLQELKIHFHLGLNLAYPHHFCDGRYCWTCCWVGCHSFESRSIVSLLGFTYIDAVRLDGTFRSVDLFFYYLFHEFALIPTFIMIGLWGGKDRRSVTLK